MHSTQWVSFITAVVIVSLMGFATVTAFGCSFGREPDPKENGIIRWVMPLNHRLRCQCTSIYPGGMNTYTPERGFYPFYTDHPLFTDLDTEIFNYFDCENCSLTNCENGGTFIDDPCHCSCAPKWTGKTCTECALKTDEDCAHGGSLSDTTSACKCTCTGNWTGNTCTECALTECKNGGTFDATTCICTCPKQWMGIICAETRHYDCQDYLKANSNSMSDVYTIYTSKYPQGLQVRCDMNYWRGSIEIQRRGSGNNVFNMGWDEYKNGFGTMRGTGSSWLGNEKVRQLTEDQDTKWEIQVEVRVGLTTQQQYEWKSYILGNFRLSGENYTIKVDGSMDCGNGCAILSANGKPFSTHDRDNDGDEGRNCAGESKGGWWFDGCDDSEINLNAEYTHNGISIGPRDEPLGITDTRLRIKRMSGET